MGIRIAELLTAALFIVCVNAAVGQSVQVLDLTTGLPIERVFVMDKEGNNGLSTDIEGRVDLTPFSASYPLTFSHTSYRDTTIGLKALEDADYRLYMLPDIIMMPTFELKAARERFVEVPGKLTVIDAEAIDTYQPRTTAELLERTGEVFVQRSQLGGGSPVLRGFEANRILLVIDGVRMNNAIYRSGHLQNAITVDPFFLEETEVLFGPGSLIYGSDALGGVIHFHSKRPKIDTARPFRLDAAFRTSTATEEKATHLDAMASGKKLAWRGSFTHSSFGEVRMGENRQHGDDDWGLIPEYVDRIDGQDTILINPDSSIDPNTAYDQFDVAQKLLWQADDSVSVLLNVQYSTSTDIPRSDQLSTYRNGRLRYAEWSYGPQDRFLASVQADVIGGGKAYDRAEFTLAYQKVGEDRITRNFDSPERFVREEDVSVFSINADMVKKMGNRAIYYGIEATNNEVESGAYITDISSGQRAIGPTRYPDGGSTMSTMAAYTDLKIDPSPTISYDLGVRYSHAYLRSDYIDTTFYRLPFESIAFNNGALTGAAGLIWNPTERWKVGVSTATGFRSPNVDDYGKVFERAGIVVVPTDDLSPEYTLNGEVKVEHRLSADRIRVELGTFYTHILDAIVQRPATLNGMDSLNYEGEMARIAVNENADEAYIYGLSAALTWAIDGHWEWSTTLSRTIGEVVGREEPLAHIPPLFAKTDLRYSAEKWKAGAFLLYNAKKSTDELAPGRTDNADRGLNGEFPEWYTLNAFMNIDLTPQLTAGLNLENITDIHYRPFASGVSAPGRNLIFSFRYSI